MEQSNELDLEREEDFAMPKLKSCDTCIHKGVCGAFNNMPAIKKKFEEKYQFCEFPAKAIALAVMCKEYTEAKAGEPVKEYDCAGCSDKDGLL